MESSSLKIGVLGIRGLPSGYSGLETSCERLYTLLAERGHEITIYCRSKAGKSRQRNYRGMRLISTPAIHSKSIETLSHVGSSLVHALLRERYDILHLHAEAPGLFLPLCKLARIPAIVTVHGLDWQRARWRGAGASVLKLAERSLAANASAIIVVSRDLQKYFGERYNRPVAYIPNGIGDPADDGVTDDSVLGKYGLEPQKYVLYLARLVPEKRVEDLLRAFEALPVSFQLAVVGKDDPGDSYVAELKKIAASNDRIVFTGFQNRAPVQSLFRNAAVYVLPSELEGLPLSLIECIDAGTPAVVTDIAPHRELLGNTVGYDLFYPPSDVEALRERLQRALAANQHYREVFQLIRNDVRKRFDWEQIAEQTEQLYFKVLSSRDAFKNDVACEPQ